jgi:glucose/arabinose dehydrogenase
VGKLIKPYTMVLAAASALVVACGDDGNDLQGPPAIAEVLLTATDSSIAVGESVPVTATALDAEGNAVDDLVFEFASGNPEVATASETGLVTAVAAGETEITATVEDVTGSLVIEVTSVTNPPPPGGGAPGLELVSDALEFPVGLASPSGDDRLFVVEKGGFVRIIDGGALLPEPFLDLSDQVSTRAEQGLLGLAFAPDYVTSGRFYVHYTNLDGDTRVSSFQVSADPNRADETSEASVLSVEQPGPAHNGGQLAFGPDGMLYIGLGDGGSRGGEDDGRGQSLGDLLGSVLRLDVSAGSGYTVPPDNPFVDVAGARGEIWSYGLRNPWRFSFDRSTGDLYIADVGETDWEEVNRSTVADGAGRGLNYGWSLMEGPDCLVDGCDQTGLTPPTVAYSHGEGCSITGGYVYRGTAVPELQGQFLFADFCFGWVHSIPSSGDPGEPVDWPALSPGDNVTSFGEDAAGELYILTASGGVFKIVSR